MYFCKGPQGNIEVIEREIVNVRMISVGNLSS